MGTIFLIISEILVLFTLLWSIYSISQFFINLRNRAEEALDEWPIPPEEVEVALRKYGTNTNSILHLYGRMHHFKPELSHTYSQVPPLAAYESLTNYNIMVTDPLCDSRDTKDVLRVFARTSFENNKKCLLLPISKQTAIQAAELGFGILQIGREPVFDLRQYTGLDHSPKILSAVRHIFKQGWKIEMVKGDHIDTYLLKGELYKITEQWLSSRKGERLEFMSEVNPFKFKSGKIYFVARMGDQVDGFLACSPIFGRNGFFFHDLLRRPTAVNGISEALTLTALKMLKDEGYHFVSLGVVPFSGLDSKGVNSNYPVLNKLLTIIFNKSKAFVKFKDLYHFKKKFDPTSEEPAFIAFYPARFSLQHIFAISSLYLPKGVYGEFLFRLRQWREGKQLPQPLLNLLSSKIATLARPVPFTFYEFSVRLKFTLFMFFLNIYTYATTSTYGQKITIDTISKYGFSFNSFLDHKWFILFTSNFLHFNFLHLIGNMTMLLIFCGTLEFIGGTALAMIVFLISMNSDVPTGFFLLPVLKIVNIPLWRDTMSYVDVGASLGIMGTLGGLLQFLRAKRWLLFLMVIVTVGLATYERLYFGLDHTIALLIGYGITHYYLNRRNRKSVLQKSFLSFDPLSHNAPVSSQNHIR